MREALRAFYARDDGNEIFQESPELKALWLAAAKIDFPVGCRVRVVASDDETAPYYVGVTGTVASYAVGFDEGRDGSWPLIGVVFDTPIQRPGQAINTRDGFYDDELEAL